MSTDVEHRLQEILLLPVRFNEEVSGHMGCAILIPSLFNPDTENYLLMMWELQHMKELINTQPGIKFSLAGCRR